MNIVCLIWRDVSFTNLEEVLLEEERMNERKNFI